MLGLIVGPKAREKTELKIWFTDILGNKYVQVVHLGRQGIWSDVVHPDDGTVRRRKIVYNSVEW